MRDYGAVSPQFWIGKTGKALRGNVAAQLVALYLMTSPHANMIGVFYVTLGSIAEETGLPLEGASKGLQSLIEAHFCQFDEDTSEVFIDRMAAFQIGEQLEAKDNRCKGVARELEKVMSDRLKAAFRAIYSVAFHLPIPAPKPAPAGPSSQAPSKPLRSQEQEQEQKQDQNNSGTYVPGGEPPDFRALVFSQGVPLLTAAGVVEKNARSMLAGLAKLHGEKAVYEAVVQTAKDGAGEPVAWLQKKLAKDRPTTGKHAGFQKLNYREGVNADGSLV